MIQIKNKDCENGFKNKQETDLHHHNTGKKKSTSIMQILSKCKKMKLNKDFNTKNTARDTIGYFRMDFF